MCLQLSENCVYGAEVEDVRRLGLGKAGMTIADRMRA